MWTSCDTRCCEIFNDLDILEIIFEKGFLENYNWFRISGKIFLKIVFSSLFTFWVEKEFWSKKVFGKKFLHWQNKKNVLLNLLGLEDQTVYKEDF